MQAKPIPHFLGKVTLITTLGTLKKVVILEGEIGTVTKIPQATKSC